MKRNRYRGFFTLKGGFSMYERIGKCVGFLVFVGVLLTMPVWGLKMEPHAKAAAQEEALSKEEYEKKFEEAVSLAFMMLADETFVNNKTYTAEQEKDLEAIITEVTQSHSVKSDFLNAQAFAEYIRNHMTLSSRQQTTTWQMLCDGDAIGAFGKPQKYGNSENYVHAFRDFCVLENIPCFMLKDEDNSKTIAMFYAERGWYFLDVADKEAVPVFQTDVYENFSSSFEPQMITFEYDVLDSSIVSLQYVAEIYIDKEAMKKTEDSNSASFYLYYDVESNTVKMFNSVLLSDENYYGTNQKSNSNGEPPKGWVDAIKYTSTTKVTIYRGYSLFGVALRGRFQVDGTEYTTTLCNLQNIPYAYIAEERKPTEEDAQYITNYHKKKQNKLEQIAEALYQDKTFIFDTKLTEEEEAFIREAVEEATSREYLETKQSLWDKVGCTLPPEGEPLSEQVKAYGILWYIRDHVQYSNILFQNSYDALKRGYAACGGYMLLMQDMCTFAGIPCFSLGCQINYGVIDGKIFSDHGYNMLRVDGKWYYADATNVPVFRERPFYNTTSFMFGYATWNLKRYYISRDDLLKEIYPVLIEGYFYDFDDNGKLGVYETNRHELIRNTAYKTETEGFYGTDEDGKIARKNGFFTFEAMKEEDGVQETWLYEGYMQQGEELEGRTMIQGQEYNFTSSVFYNGVPYTCYAKKLVKRQYVISHLEYEAIPDQEYTGKAVCPIPVIKHGDKILISGVDYTITYKDNQEITNGYSVHTSYTVEGIGDYTGKAIRYFNIVKKDISNIEVGFSKTAYNWDFEAQRVGWLSPEILLDLSEREYTVRYENNYTAGTAKVMLQGKNHCYGTVTKEFQILPAIFNEKSFRIVAWDGKEWKDTYECESGSAFRIEPEIAIQWFNEEGTESQRLGYNDYTVTYENTDKFGTATIRVQGVGKFSGTLEKHFTIKEKEKTDITKNQEFMNVMQRKGKYAYPPRYSVVYTGEPVCPQIPGVTYVTPYTWNFVDMEKDVDFVVNVSNNINAGEGILTVQGIGNYTGSVTISFDILPKEIKREDVELMETRVPYNGEIQQPKVTVSGLMEGIDFTVVCQKWLQNGDTFETVEPVNAGYYLAAIQLLNPNYTFDDCVAGEDGYYRIGYEIMAVGVVPTLTPSKTSVDQSEAEKSITPESISTTKPEGAESTKYPDTTKKPKTTKTPSAQTAKPTVTGKPTTTDKTKDTLPKVVKVTKYRIVAKNKGFILKWKKVSGTKGYQIQVSMKKNFKDAKRISIKPSQTSYKLSKLKSGKKYYIRIRAYKSYKNDEGKTKKVYGKWVTMEKKTK